MTPQQALEAMLADAQVRVGDGPPCRVDEIYRSIYSGDVIRARMVDRHGLVHHYDVDRLEAVAVAA